MATKSLTDRAQDLPYVVLGAGDAAVEYVRSVPTQLTSFPQQLREGFDGLADRGRTLRTEVERDPKVRQAGRQTSAAKSRVKAAATSTRKAASANAKAAESAAGKVG
jgi:hypothetical protein